MGVIRVNDLDELRAKVADTQKALASLYFDDEVWGMKGASLEMWLDAFRRARVAMRPFHSLVPRA